jgi:septal ring factor EnvC (AmiA/AmiB activator)
MRRRSRKLEAPITLFSFQDLMACLTGVLILVVLVIAIEGLSNEMRMAADQSTPEATTATEAEVRTQLEQLKSEVNALERELEARQRGAVVTEEEIAVLEARLARRSGTTSRARASHGR